MSDAYAIVRIPKSLPLHWMGLTSTGRKIEHNKVVVGTQTSESLSWISASAGGAIGSVIWPGWGTIFGIQVGDAVVGALID